MNALIINQVDLRGKKTKWQPQGNKVKIQETPNPLCFKASNANICALSVISDRIQGLISYIVSPVEIYALGFKFYAMCVLDSLWISRSEKWS